MAIVAPGPIREQAIDDALAEQERLQQEKMALQQDSDDAQAETRRLQADMVARKTKLEVHSHAIIEAKQKLEEQTLYCNLFADGTGRKDLNIFDARLKHLENEHQAMQHEYAKLDEHDNECISQLWGTIMNHSARIKATEHQISVCAETRNRLRREHGEAMFVECDALLTNMEHDLQEQQANLHMVQSSLNTARLATIKRLEQWPDIRRRLEVNHKVCDDGTTDLLQSAIATLDLILMHGRKIDPLLLSKLEIQHLDLMAILSSDSSLIAGRKEHLVVELQRYRARLSAGQGTF